MFQLYHDFPWLIYQYSWSFYPNTSESVPHNPERQGGKPISTIFKVFGMTRPGIEPATSRTRGGRTTTTPPRRY